MLSYFNFFIFNVFVMSCTSCKASDLDSLGGELFVKKISLRRSHNLGAGILLRSYLIYKLEEPNSALSCNKYFTLISVRGGGCV